MEQTGNRADGQFKKITSGNLLRNGYTTGTCAALAAKASVIMALTGKEVQRVEIIVPRGDEISCEVLQPEIEHSRDGIGTGIASCAIQKDGGDDIDVTHGLLIFARAQLLPCEKLKQSVEITAGEGIGIVTKPGLSVPVGEFAINPVPKSMIENAVREELLFRGYKGGARITISVPQGEEIAKKTFNEKLGIKGGISIIGTSGIVEPMSEKALVDTIKTEINVAKAENNKILLLVPGNYGEDFVKKELELDGVRLVTCSNFVGEAIDYGVQTGFENILLIGHIGKFVKLAAGIFNTHSHVADGRMEIFASHSALCNAPAAVIKKIMECVSTDGAIDILKEYDLSEKVMESILRKMNEHLMNRVRGGKNIRIGAITFSKIHGLLGMTEGGEILLKEVQAQVPGVQWKEEK